MKSKQIEKCYICGTEFDVNEDICPRCQWYYLGYEHEYGENEYVSVNGMTIKQAKENYKKGLTVFGEPLKTTPKDT